VLLVISVAVRRDELVRHQACADGLALFDRILAQCGPRSRKLGRIYVREWTPLHWAWLLVNHCAFAGWLAEKGIVSRANLSGANLSGANLSGANLSGANLSWANLSWAYRGSSSSIPGWRTSAAGYLERDTSAEAAE
jgi:hypothetical protein